MSDDAASQKDDFSLFESDEVVFYIFPTDRKRDVQTLKDLIDDYGGLVVDYHDKEVDDRELKQARGLALIDPSQLHAPDFLKRKTRADKDGNVVLYYLNWGYPQLCVDVKEIVEAETAREALILTQKASKNGGWTFFLSPTLDFDKASLKMVEDRIMKHGGVVVNDEAKASIVIASDDPDEFDEERLRFEKNPRTRVEQHQWLVKTLKRRKYVRFSYSPMDTPMPGRTPLALGGRRRVYHTKTDDQHLIEFLASYGAIDGSGRRGRDIYKLMCSDPQARPWTTAHTRDAWRLRYERKMDEFDQRIEAYIQDNTPFRDKHGQDSRTRSANKRRVKAPRRSVRTAIQAGSAEPENLETKGSEQGEEQAEVDSQSRISRKRNSRSARETIHEEPQVSAERDVAEYIPGEALEMDAYEPFEDLSAMPKSTPPRRQPSNGSQITLVDKSDSAIATKRPPPLKSRNVYDFSEYNSALNGIYGIPDDDNVGSREVLKGKKRKAAGDERVELAATPHLDMMENRRRPQRKSAGSVKSVAEVEAALEESLEEEDDDEIPARSFHLSGSVRRSGWSNVTPS